MLLIGHTGYVPGELSVHPASHDEMNMPVVRKLPSIRQAESPRRKRELTEHEGMLLALILRQQPVTAYQLFRLYERSPVTSINASKGQVYPAIARLKARELVTGCKISRGGRSSEELHITDAGKQATRHWVRNINASHIVLDDPLRIRLSSFDVLTREEKLEWIAQAKLIIKERAQAVEEYDRSVVVPFQQFTVRSVMEVLQAKMNWLDDLLYAFARTP
jgi:DNA-binding PadR family transcriptional regulator